MKSYGLGGRQNNLRAATLLHLSCTDSTRTVPAPQASTEKRDLALLMSVQWPVKPVPPDSVRGTSA